MAEFCMVASHGYPPSLVLCPEQFFSRPSKEFQPFVPGLRSRQDMTKSCSLHSESYQIDEPWKPIGGFSDSTEFVKIDQAIRRHILNGSQDTNPNLILLSIGVARQIIRHEKFLKLLMSGSSVIENGELDPSVLSDLTGLEALSIDQQPLFLERGWHSCDDESHESQPSLIFPSEFCFQEPLFDMTMNMPFESSFSGPGTEMKDILSIFAEFNLSSNSYTKWDKHSLIVPYFTRRKNSAAKAGACGSLNLGTVKADPLKSSEKTKAKQSLKKRNNKTTDREREMYTNNYVLACETLLSIMFDKKRHDKTAILSLKKSGPELPHLLTQFSASIAGTGIAVLFCVVCKVACGRAPLCTSRILSTGLGIGLVWFSWAVNRLRDAVLCISKRSSKSDHGEEDTLKILDRSVNEIYFRAATLLAVVVLRLA